MMFFLVSAWEDDGKQSECIWRKPHIVPKVFVYKKESKNQAEKEKKKHTKSQKIVPFTSSWLVYCTLYLNTLPLS